DHSGTARVVLYRDAALSLRVADNPDTGVHGAGRFVGLWLVRAQDSNATNTDYVSVYRLPSFAGSAVRTFGSRFPTGQCTPVGEDVEPVYWDCSHLPKPREILLHQGHYTVHVVTDGAPVTFTLRLHG